jgi:hypothetical protein
MTTNLPNSNLGNLFSFGEYTFRHWITVLAFVVAFGVAVLCVNFFLSSKLPATRALFIQNRLCLFAVFFWTFAPPAWFFFEYFVLWSGTTADDLKRVLDGQRLAQPFWGAVLATLLFLIPR